MGNPVTAAKGAMPCRHCPVIAGVTASMHQLASMPLCPCSAVRLGHLSCTSHHPAICSSSAFPCQAQLQRQPAIPPYAEWDQRKLKAHHWRGKLSKPKLCTRSLLLNSHYTLVQHFKLFFSCPHHLQRALLFQGVNISQAFREEAIAYLQVVSPANNSIQWGETALLGQLNE